MLKRIICLLLISVILFLTACIRLDPNFDPMNYEGDGELHPDTDKYDSKLWYDTSNVETHGKDLMFAMILSPAYYEIDGIPKEKFVVACMGGMGGCINNVLRHKDCRDVPLFDYPLQDARITRGGKTFPLEASELTELLACLKENIAKENYCSFYSLSDSSYQFLEFIADFQESNSPLCYHTKIRLYKDTEIAYFSFDLYQEEASRYEDIAIPLSEELTQKLLTTFETK